MTYSILAADADGVEFGVATASHALSVGSGVPFAVPGVGVIASQSVGEPMYGEIGLELLRGGFTAAEALRALMSVDPRSDQRQVAILGVDGDRAAHTGSRCVGAAGQALAEHCIAIANTARGPQVWRALVDGFAAARGSHADRLVAALGAAEEAGGDLRGGRSAAILVVRRVPTGRPWHDTVVDLRVDDDMAAVAELAQLVRARARYQQVVRAFEQAVEGDPQTAERMLAELGPQHSIDPDQLLWRALVAALAGREDAARVMFVSLRTDAPQFIDLAGRYARAGLVPEDLLARVLPTGPAEASSDPSDVTVPADPEAPSAVWRRPPTKVSD